MKREGVTITERGIGEGNAPKHHRKGMPALQFDGEVSQEVRDAVLTPTAEHLAKCVTIENWRRYDRRLFGQLIHPSGDASNQTNQVPGLFIRLVPREGWAYFDTGIYYRLGGRAYAGT